ncbi:MAG: hypothetical protein ACK5GI_09940 [Ignavibacteria bacterium]|jgi:hypothetical protein
MIREKVFKAHVISSLSSVEKRLHELVDWNKLSTPKDDAIVVMPEKVWHPLDLFNRENLALPWIYGLVYHHHKRVPITGAHPIRAASFKLPNVILLCHVESWDGLCVRVGSFVIATYVYVDPKRLIDLLELEYVELHNKNDDMNS